MRELKPICFILLLLGILTLASAPASGEILFPDGSMIKQKCSACHKPDAQGNLDVLEHTRKTTEEWKAVVDRMIRLNSLPLENENFHPVIKELSAKLCLSPKEMEAVAYLNSDENSQYREIPKDDMEKRIFTACVRCHTYGKIVSHKNTPEQWAEARNLHLGYYPTVVPQMREMDWPVESQALIDPLSKLFPFDNPEWKEWMKNRKPVDLSGEWTVAGYQPGMGFYEGSYAIKADAASGKDEYLIEKEIRYGNGKVFKSSGKGTLFSDFHLRYALSSTADKSQIEGVFDLKAPDMAFNGKWWAVVQDKNVYGNEMFAKAGSTAKIIGAYPEALQTNKMHKVTLIGVNLPSIKAADITFSKPGISVAKITQTGATKIVCDVNVKPAAGTGVFGIKVGTIAYDNAMKVYTKMDAIKVLPEIGRARVSCGPAYPAHGVQFVARGISAGPDGKVGTEDDLVLNPVDAKWSLAEEKTRENDDDLKYLTTPVTNGLYTPVTTYGPIASRVQKVEGTGLIQIIASYNKMESSSRLAVVPTDFIPQIK
jgi:quinohemoprotein amine dehydrogenase alpha subunit